MQAFTVTVKSIHRGIQVGVPFILLCVCAVVPLFIPTVRSLLEYGEETAPLTFFGISMVALFVALAAAFHSAGSDVYNKKVEPAALSALLACFVCQLPSIQPVWSVTRSRRAILENVLQPRNAQDGLAHLVRLRNYVCPTTLELPVEGRYPSAVTGRLLQRL
ncbi:hypothetical protein DFH06DRAFT_679323 [Mycena polygramma]|nr:hypothetical protein DFH06DRAFT_679323 [Mycena polygramma]